MNDVTHTGRTLPEVLVAGRFSHKLRIYLFAQWTFVLVATVIGIALLPVWLVLGPAWVRRYHASLRCELTERSVVVGKGIFFRRELTIPLDKIQDISIREGPLLTAFGLLQLRIETAGQSNSGTGKSDSDLVGLLDARALRDRILEQRDLLAAQERAPAPAEPERQLLTEIRDSLLRLEGALAARAGDGDAPVR